MIATCYNCGAENEGDAELCGKCGRPLGDYGDLLEKDLRAFSGEERVVWDNGELQLTTGAVLIGLKSDAPDVIPLDAIYDVQVEDRCVVLKIKNGDDVYCVLDKPDELARLMREQVFRPRYAHRRKDDDVIPSD